LRDLGKKTKNTAQAAGKLGGLIAERLAKLGISEAVLDRSGYRYHGKVKALTEGAREKGLKI
jgi:large subunit ribosomal protein L18